MNKFEYCAGSLVGSNHRLFGKNNQDAYQVIDKENLLIAVVCDGCGSGPYSEVGAQLGSIHLIHEIEYYFSHGLNAPSDKIFNKILSTFLFTLDSFIPSRQLIQFINDYLLFTINGCTITEKELITFRIGDGITRINDVETIYKPDKDNKPDYIAYNLLKDSYGRFKFEIKTYPIEDINYLILGTDGANELCLDRFKQDKYYKNPDLLRRYLFNLNKHVHKEIWEGSTLVGNEIKHGLLTDDCTLVCIRRK